jgi:hypothetical protein
VGHLLCGCTTGGILEGGMDTGAPGIAGGDRAEVVACGVLLCAHSAGWFVYFAQFHVVSVALAIVAV